MALNGLSLTSIFKVYLGGFLSPVAKSEFKASSDLELLALRKLTPQYSQPLLINKLNVSHVQNDPGC